MTTRDQIRTASTPTTSTLTTGASTRRDRRLRRTTPGGRTAALLALLALASTTGTTGAVAAPTAAAAPARYSHQQLTWQTCAEEAALECATMTAPRDWHHPGRGPDITVAVSRHRATDPARRIGTLITAAGGPGGQGLLRPADHVRNAPALGASYDIIGFDQRGVGRSTRAVCQTPRSSAPSSPGTSATTHAADRARVIANSAALAAGFASSAAAACCPS